MLDGRALGSKTSHFISWLRQRGVHEEHSALSIGASSSGRGMFASRPIIAGERMLEVPTSLMITSGSLEKEVSKLLPSHASEWSRLALFILAQWNKGQESAWDSYMEILPSEMDLHNTVFWKPEELQCVKHSAVYFKTMQRKRLLESEFAAVQNVISHCGHIFGQAGNYNSFKHAYSIVASRSWRVKDICELGMVPYIDLINHDWRSNSLLSNDPDKNCVLVIADRDYAVGEEVSISYGQLSNAILAVDYGFSLPYNPYDEAEIWVTLSPNDPLFDAKLDLFYEKNILVMQEEDGSLGKAFVIQDVISNSNGIPLDLWSFARVLSAKTPEELERLALSSSESSGEFSWNSAERHNDHRALIEIRSQLTHYIDRYVRADLAGDVHGIEDETRREMAKSILDGELRILKAAWKWLEKHPVNCEVNSRSTSSSTGKDLRKKLLQSNANSGLPSSFPMTPIGYMRSCYSTRNGTPRQPLLVTLAKSCLVLTSGVPAGALDGINEYSHCWLLYAFHENTDLHNLWEQPSHRDFKAKVRVPRLNGGKLGVFATRTPHRPCPIGLTVAKVERVDNGSLFLSGADLVDGTPVLDIKPYLPYCDSIREACAPKWVKAGGEDDPLAVAAVTFSEASLNGLDECWDKMQRFSLYTGVPELRDFIAQVLSRDIRSLSQRQNPHTGVLSEIAQPLYGESTSASTTTTTSEASESNAASLVEDKLVLYNVILEGLKVSYTVDTHSNVEVKGIHLSSHTLKNPLLPAAKLL